MKSEDEGFRTTPPYTGQRPPRIRKSEDFPQPLGPTMSKCCCKVRQEMVPASYNKVAYPWLNMEAQAANENISVGSHDGNILELDLVVRMDYLTSPTEDCTTILRVRG